MSIAYKNNIASVMSALPGRLSGFMSEVGGEVQTQAQRKVRVDTGKTKGSYKYEVSESDKQIEVAVGSDYQNAIYEEFGTGQYALHGNGRKTPWVYQDSKGDWHRTSGKSPTRPLFTAFSITAPKAQKQIANILKDLGG